MQQVEQRKAGEQTCIRMILLQNGSQWRVGTFYLFFFISDFGKTVQFCFFLLHLNSGTDFCSLKTSDALYVFSVDQKRTYNSSDKIKCNKKNPSKIQLHLKTTPQ